MIKKRGNGDENEKMTENFVVIITDFPRRTSYYYVS